MFCFDNGIECLVVEIVWGGDEDAGDGDGDDRTAAQK